MSPVLFNKNENKLIEFGDTTEFVIGRSIDHHLAIPDSTISRKQCIIKKVPEGEWLVIDLSSFKTSLVNGSNIPSSGLYIKSGDTITFGNQRTWQLEFYLSVEDMPPTTKRRRAADEVSEPGSQESLRTEVSECTQPKKPRMNDDYQTKYEAVLLEKANLTESVENLKLKVKELEEAKETADDILVSSHLDRKLLHTDYEDSCTEIDRLVNERQFLLEEIQENIKKKEAAEALGSGCGSSSQSSEIESSLILKTIEVEELKDELTEAKSRLEKAEEISQSLLTQSEKIHNDAIAIIEQEFLCCVCSDLMYEPVTLNCRHTLCSDCLKEWKKKKKECPSCRTKIKTEVRPLMVDSFIDRIAPLLGNEFVKKRQEAKNDRAAPRTPPPPPPPAAYPRTAGPSHVGGRGRRGNRRGGRGGYNANYSRGPPPAGIPHPFPEPSLNGDVIDLTNRSPESIRRRNESAPTDEDDSNAAVADFVDAVEATDAIGGGSFGGGSFGGYPFGDSDNFEDEYDESEIDDNFEDEYDESEIDDEEEEVDEDEVDADDVGSYDDDYDGSEDYEDDIYSDEL